ncbi:hypothetical protein CVT25_000223 [Psilocybe cyanescens]|uniref:Uncharacterized protein n=1 Tax=Psilocybe cyanescens TaxID=93625 RepID=A0A409WE29_PSICY|nr:hypothetical protein CVT25_000223 [Psilocybe cyanescens]
MPDKRLPLISGHLNALRFTKNIPKRGYDQARIRLPAGAGNAAVPGTDKEAAERPPTMAGVGVSDQPIQISDPGPSIRILKTSKVDDWRASAGKSSGKAVVVDIDLRLKIRRQILRHGCDLTSGRGCVRKWVSCSRSRFVVDIVPIMSLRQYLVQSTFS